jgi:hypothetical protein
MSEPEAQVGREAYVIQAAFAIERVNAMTIANVLPDDVLVLFKGAPGNVFQVLAD